MATTRSKFMVRLTTGRWSGDIVGSVITTILGLIHLYGLQLGGSIGTLLLLVVWPVIGGAVGSRLERSRPDGRDWGTTSALTGTFGGLVVALIVFLTGLAGAWSGFITTTFGVTFGPVVFTVLIVFTITWTVFGYTGGFIESWVAGSFERAQTE